ncbi:MAG TPA: trehalase family glycosidase [Candidatus Saccharimonadia bacterium]|nr:trehalase family glycosidase [Candidatus Saccharimonadia bacterium]
MSSTHEKLGPRFSKDRLQPALEYIDRYWKKLERYNPRDDGTLIGLPEPYFIPSARNDTGFAYEEMYYWDSYFIAQGLMGTPREYRVRGMVDNLLSLMQRFQVIPNSGRFYMTGRSQPPFLTSFIMEAYHIEKDKRWLEQAMSVAKHEYRTVWMGTTQPNWRQVFHGLSRFYDINVLDDLAEAESGWDMTTRFERRALSYLPVDLNALLYKYESDFAEAARILGYEEESHEWMKRQLSRVAMMRRYLWDDDKGFYFDYNYMTSRHSPVYSLAAFYPMWAGMDSDETARRIMDQLERFECDGGLATSAERPHVRSDIPTQWAYPNGWAPLQMIAVQAMERYGYHVAAERVARKWINANLVQFEANSEFFEKYNVVHIEREPVEGVYPSQTGFGWTNAVFAYFCQRYLAPDELPHIQSTGQSPSALRQLVKDPRRTLRKVGMKIDTALPKRQL